MGRQARLLTVGLLLLPLGLRCMPAEAAETPAGTVVTNSVTLTYKVDSVEQSPRTATDSFTVDRKVSLTVSEVGGAATTVAPGQSKAVTTFDVINSSNATINIGLTVTQQDGGATPHAGTDDFDLTGVTIYLDNGDNIFNSSSDTVVTFLSQVPADASRRVFVAGDVPVSRVNRDAAGLRLSGQAREHGAAEGAIIRATAGTPQKNAVDTVLADAKSSGGNTQYDGIDFEDDDYSVFAPSLTLAKSSRLISDPINGTTAPKMIPGAVVEYCIALSNAPDSATATSVSVEDRLPSETTFVPNTLFVQTTLTGTACNQDGVAGGTFAGSTVSASLPDLEAGQSTGVRFQVVIN